MAVPVVFQKVAGLVALVAGVGMGVVMEFVIGVAVLRLVLVLLSLLLPLSVMFGLWQWPLSPSRQHRWCHSLNGRHLSSARCSTMVTNVVLLSPFEKGSRMVEAANLEENFKSATLARNEISSRDNTSPGITRCNSNRT